MRQFAVILSAVVFVWTLAMAQEEVTVGTGVPVQEMQDGDIAVSGAPVTVPRNTNRRGTTLDVSKHTNSSVCIFWALEQSVNDGPFGFLIGDDLDNPSGDGLCGRAGGFKDKVGNKVSSIQMIAGTSLPLPDGVKLRVRTKTVGGSVSTGSAIQMWEVK